MIGNAGTINTGSIDGLQALGDLCEREQLWFHVDGAIGALVPLAPRYGHLMKGIERADSIAMDLHKWLHVPFEAGVALFRSESLHRQTFSLTPDYLSRSERGMASGAPWFSDYGLQLTRSFRALKAWLSIKEHGVLKYGQLIDQNIAQAHYLAGLIEKAPQLGLLAPVTINIACIRYKPAGWATEALNRLNQELLIRLHESGLVAPSYTTLEGRYCLRAAIANYCTRRQNPHFEYPARTRINRLWYSKLDWAATMVEFLLTTKLTIPPVRENLVVRPHLIEQLDCGLKVPFILVTAPAGFGKTTLLAAWASRSKVPVAWLTLDEGENDPARFLDYLYECLARFGLDGTAAGGESLPVLQDRAAALTVLVNRVAGFGSELVLVLDDYHRITAQPIHDMLVNLLDHCPPNLHLFIASRADPPLPVARFRARGQLVELHLQDLRFSQVEAAAFLNQIMHLELDPRNVETLHSRTEGWIAGLQMAAISLKNIQDRTRFIESFSGSNRFVLDYLMEEVLGEILLDEKRFLLLTSILEQMCGPLCEAVVPDLQPGEGQSMLERLERSNLFVLPLDDQRAWYRYHRLFADLLRQKLISSQLTPEGELHRRASEWYEANGYTLAAIDHALAARDYERAGGLIETAAEDTLLHSQLATLLGWVKSLPPEQFQKRPVLRMYNAWAQLFSGEPLHEIMIVLKELAGEPAILPGQLAPLMAYVAVFQGQIAQAIQLARQALLVLPEEDRFLRSVATWIENLDYVISGDRATAPETLQRVITFSQSVGNRMLSVMVMCSQADIYLSRGDLALAEQMHQNALDLAKDPLGNFLPIAGIALTRLGEIYRERNRLGRAEEAILQGIQLLSPWNELGTIYGYICLAQVQQASGDASAANSTLSRAARLAASFDVSQIDDRMVELVQQRVYLRQGELTPVRNWIMDREFARPKDLGAYGDLLIQWEQIILARALIALGSPQEALALLAPIIKELEKKNRQRRLVEVLALTALANQTLGEQDNALASIERALKLAEKRGFVRTLLDEGEPMRAILILAKRHGVCAGYSQYLLDEFAQNSNQEPRAGGIDQRELLSPREHEVLDLIALGMSNQEISERLYVSVRTVKFHTSNIFSKLGVTNRTQAVARARDLGLLVAE